MAEKSSANVIFREDVTQFLCASLCNNKDEWSPWYHWLTSSPSWTVLRVNSHRFTRQEAKSRLRSFLAEHRKTHEGCAASTMLEHPVLDDTLMVASPRADPPPEPTKMQVIVGLQCGVAVLRGADVFAPGVLAMDPAVQKGDAVSVFADIEGLCRRGLTKPFDGPTQYVGNGHASLSRYALFHAEQPSGVAISMTTPLYTSLPLSGLHADMLFPQNLPSIVACHVLAPRPGETVLDMCAAPGGKTTHIASLMKDRGIIVALDKSAARLKRVDENCKKLDIHCVRSFVCDARKSVASPSAECSTVSASLVAPPFPPESFDRVLLDAPCSALGQRPQIRNKMPLKELLSFPTYQRHIFAKAVELLRPGGVLVYCTCTLTLEENEGAVVWALAQFPSLTLVSQDPHLGQPGYVVDGLEPQQAKLLQRFALPAALGPRRSGFLPEAINTHPEVMDEVATSSASKPWSVDEDTIGFFIAKFVKKL